MEFELVKAQNYEARTCHADGAHTPTPGSLLNLPTSVSCGRMEPEKWALRMSAGLGGIAAEVGSGRAGEGHKVLRLVLRPKNA